MPQTLKERLADKRIVKQEIAKEGILPYSLLFSGS